MEMKNLRYLNLSYNNMGQKGALAIVPVLAEMKNIRVLDMRDNDIDQQGALAFANILASHTELTYVYIHDSVDDAINQTCQTNKKVSQKCGIRV